ncbi:MAG: hypothetical protein R3D62_18740 [Xanthobacteraceae bacterium]
MTATMMGVALSPLMQRPVRTLGLRLLAILLFAALPLVNVAVAVGLASALGCTLNEAGVNPCPLLGIDLGQVLAGMAVLGWLGLAKIPAAAILILAWFVVLLVVVVNLLRERGRSPPR